MEFQFLATPSTITVRRNPRRKVRETPSSNAPDLPAPPLLSSAIKPLSLDEILEPEPDPPQIPPSLPKPSEEDGFQNLRVFLRIRPLDLNSRSKKKSPSRSKSSRAELEKEKRTKKKIPAKQAICLVANNSRSVTLSVPPSLNESKRKKSEIYDGFSHVFTADSLQSEVYDCVMEPLVSDFMKGKSRLLAALGPTGSGKTHTVFGSPREPGLVPLALRQIFNKGSGTGAASKAQRSFYLSMFEVCSEQRKGERISDLSTDIPELRSQQSTIKGVKEAMVTNIMQAQCFIDCGLLKRATAATNANNQSSRSQCIINIRGASAMCDDDEVGFVHNDAVLTIVDLAGAERERRTGIQGARLLESNFINNTSMIFGLCLRSLLEHQKNPKKPLEKHFQNSLLTKYLRDYLEGKKRMTLILTAKAGEDDYADTSFLLRHASPYMKIKFVNTEELPNMPCQKRHVPPSNRTNQLKRRKYNDVDTFVGSSEIGGKCGNGVSQTLGNGGKMIAEQLGELELQQDLVSPLPSKMELQSMERKYQIMQDFSKALWNVLKQYKKKLEVSENGVKNLEESLKNEKVQFLDLQIQLNKLKSSCSCHVRSSTKMSSNSELISASSTGADSCSIKKTLDHSSSREIYDNSVRQNLEVENSNEVVVASKLSMTEFKSENYESLESKAKCFNTIESAAEDLAGLEVNDISPIADITGCKLSIPSGSPCGSQVSDQEGSCDLVSLMDQNILSEEKENYRSKVLLGSQESPIKDAGGSRRCQVPDVPNGEKRHDSFSKHLSMEKPRRKLLPASSMLVKEVGAFDMEDDNQKNNKKAEKMTTVGGRRQTQGSISLVRLLRNNLYL